MAEPKIRFKQDNGNDFPIYQKMSMSEIFTEITDKKHPDLPVLSIQQGVGTVLRDESGRNINYDKTNLNGYKAMQKGDFIIHLRSFEGGLECSNHNGISSPAYRILRTNQLVPEAYQGYFRTYKFIEGKLAVAVVGIRDGKNIDMPTFWEIELDVPCLEEQQKIANFLSDVDEVIAQSEAEVAALEKQKKGVMQKIFSQEVRFKKDDGSDFPEWKIKNLGDLCYLRGRIGFRGYTKEDIVSQGNGVVSLSPSNIVDGFAKYEKSTYISYEKYDESPEIKVAQGDILFTKTGSTVGKIGFVKELKEPSTINPQIALISAKDCNAYFLYISMIIERSQKFVKSITVGGALPTLSQEALQKMEILLPCLEEQQKIADFLSSFDEAIDLAKQELEKWKLLKKGLLQQMFI